MSAEIARRCERQRDDPTDADQQDERMQPRVPNDLATCLRKGGNANRCCRDGPEPGNARDDLSDHLRAPGLFDVMVTIERSSWSAGDSGADFVLGMTIGVIICEQALLRDPAGNGV